MNWVIENFVRSRFGCRKTTAVVCALMMVLVPCTMGQVLERPWHQVEPIERNWLNVPEIQYDSTADEWFAQLPEGVLAVFDVDQPWTVRLSHADWTEDVIVDLEVALDNITMTATFTMRVT